MAIPIGLGLFYFVTVLVGITRRTWSPTIRKRLTILHFGFLALLLLDLLFALTTERNFRGVYSDRIVFSGVLLSGALFFICWRKEGNFALRLYSGFYVFYPIVALAAILVDRILFLIVVGPILISVMIPDVYYKSNRYDIRANTGFLAPREIVLVEKGLLMEKQVGRAEYPDDDDVFEVREIEVKDVFADSVFVKLRTTQGTQLVVFRR